MVGGSLSAVLSYSLEGSHDDSSGAEPDEDVVTVGTKRMSVCLLVSDYCG